MTKYRLYIIQDTVKTFNPFANDGEGEGTGYVFDQNNYPGEGKFVDFCLILICDKLIFIRVFLTGGRLNL